MILLPDDFLAAVPVEPIEAIPATQAAEERVGALRAAARAARAVIEARSMLYGRDHCFYDWYPASKEDDTNYAIEIEHELEIAEKWLLEDLPELMERD